MDSTGCLLDAVSIFVDHLGRMNESINYQNGRPRACGFVGYVGAVPVWKNAPVRVRARARAGMWQYACAEDRGLETRCYQLQYASLHVLLACKPTCTPTPGFEPHVMESVLGKAKARAAARSNRPFALLASSQPRQKNLPPGRLRFDADGSFLNV